MSSALQKNQARRLRKEQRLLEQWEQVRVEGKTGFVRRTALTYGLTVTGLNDILQRFFQGEAQPLPLMVFVFLIGGFLMASDTWSSMEAKRKDALRKAHAKES